MIELFAVAIFVYIIFILWCFWRILSTDKSILLERNIDEFKVAIGEPFLPILTSITERAIKILDVLVE